MRLHAAMFSYDIDIGHDEEEFIAEFIARYGHEIITITDTIFKQRKRDAIKRPLFFIPNSFHYLVDEHKHDQFQ